MIHYLLFPVLILHGVAGSQTTNVTEKVEGNQTFSVSTMFNSTMKPVDVTSSLYKDETREIEDELQNNQTSFIREDDENFQDQEMQIPGRQCNHRELIEYSHVYCIEEFHLEMQRISPENWCTMENIIRPYNKVTLCLEYLSQIVNCFYPNPEIQDLFVYIHSSYFQNCSKEEPVFVDPPHGLVITLTLIPVCLIPILVYVVIWKSKIQE